MFTRSVLLLAMALASWQLAAQPYPDRPIRLLVGGAPGSVPDTMIRPVAERLAASLGQPVVVENRPGAAGSIAMDALVRAAPDGYTLALATMSQAVFNSYLFSRLPYDPLRDLAPVAPLVTGAMALAAHPSFAARSLQEVIDLAKAQPGKLFVAMPQAGSPPHVVALLVHRAAGVQLTMVPHKSGSEAIGLALSGGVPLVFDAPTIISPHVKTGKLVPIVVTGREREPALPGVPTLEESGLRGVHGEAWIGLVARAGTPRPVIERLNHEAGRAMASAQIQQLMQRFSFRTLSATPDEFASLIREEHQKWSAVIREAGLKLD